MKNIRILTENYQFLVVKFSIYLNRRVFVMVYSRTTALERSVAHGDHVSIESMIFFCNAYLCQLFFIV